MLNLIKELQKNSLEFEAWLANCVENFEISKYSLQEFKSIIENKDLFEKILLKLDIMIVFLNYFYLQNYVIYHLKITMKINVIGI